MNNKTNINLVSLVVGLCLGQIIVLLVVNPEGWQAIDKVLFGVGIGMSIYAFLLLVNWIFFNKK